MNTGDLAHVLRHLRTLAAAQTAGDLTDAELLERFRRHREEAAFTILLHRHGPMVLAACRRVLRDRHDAEDAFQATFLVLVRRADSVRKAGSLGSWLYGVALRVAAKARGQAARRRAREQRAAAVPPAGDDMTSPELRPVLDEELARLPEKYRAPLVLCYLEGKVQEEAARELGCPRTSLASRLVRARNLLRERLAARGFVLPAGVLAGVLAEQAAPAAVPALLTIATARGAVLLAGGQAVAAGAVSRQVLGLAEGVVKAMAATNVTLGAAFLVALAAGAGLAGYHMLAAPPPAPPVAAPGPSVPALRAGTDAQGDPLPEGAVARLGTVRFRHGQWVEGLGLSPDGRVLATVGGFNQVRLWDADSGRLVRSFTTGKGRCRAVAFAPDGNTMAFAGDYEVLCLDAATGRVVHRFDSARVTSVAFAPDGKTLAVGLLDGGVLLADPAGVGPARRLQSDPAARSVERTWAVAYSPDGRFLAWGEGGRVMVKDVRADKLVGGFEGHEGMLWTIAFAPDGKTLATAGADRAIKLWNPATGELLRRLSGHAAPVMALSFSPDGRLLASGAGNALEGTGRELHALRVWDVARAEEVARLGTYAEGVPAVRFARDGKRLFAADGGSVHVWDVARRAEVATAGHHGWVGGLSFAPDGRTLATAGADMTVRLWDVPTARERQALTGHEATIDSVAFSPDGKRLASGSRDGRVILRELAGGRQVKLFAPFGPGWEARVAFSPDGTRLATASRDGRLVLWDATTGEEVRAFPRSPDGFQSLAFSPDGRLLATGGETRFKGQSKNLLHLWDVATGQEVHRLQGDLTLMIQQVAFSPDGRLLAAVGWGRTIDLWSVAAGTLEYRIQVPDLAVNHAAFSPDGRILATTGYGDATHLWETWTGKERGRLQGHRGYPNVVAFAPGGRLLATGSADTTVLLWDLAGPGSPAQLSPDELAARWDDLAGSDAARTYRAVRSLAAAGSPAVSFLERRVQPIAAPDAGRLARLLADLDSPRFAVREAAEVELERLGKVAEPALQKLVAGRPPLETRRRAERLLEKLHGPITSGVELRSLRAIEVLEQIGTPAARAVLERLAQGAPGARPTQDARASLDRLARRRTAP